MTQLFSKYQSLHVEHDKTEVITDFKKLLDQGREKA